MASKKFVGAVYRVDPMFNNLVIDVLTEVRDTLEDVLFWVNALIRGASGTHVVQVYEVNSETWNIVSHFGSKATGNGTMLKGEAVEKTRIALSGIVEAMRELDASDNEPEDDDKRVSLLQWRVAQVKATIESEAEQAKANANSVDFDGFPNDGGPVARIELHSKSVDTFQAGTVPTNHEPKRMMDFHRAEMDSLGEGVLIAVLDTGCNRDHNCLRGRVLPVIDATGIGSDAADVNGHGTAVVSQIISDLPSGTPFGTARTARILPIRVLHPVEGWGTDSQIARGVRAAKAAGAHVISMSLGGDGELPLTHEALKEAYQAGIIIVAAAGNAGSQRTHVAYPAAYVECWSVGSVNEKGQPSSFSQNGPELDVFACGENQPVALAAGGYGRWSGTSMATPHVAAAAAFFLSWSEEETGHKYANLQFEVACLKTALEVIPARSGDTQGVGLIQVGEIMRQVKVAPTPPTPPTNPPTAIEISWDHTTDQWYDFMGQVHRLMAERKPVDLMVKIRPAA